MDVNVENLRRALPLDSSVLAYVSGSLSAGFHNPQSDVDVYLITADSGQTDWHGRQLFLDSRRIDITHWTVDQWSRISERVRQADATGLEPSQTDIVAYYRATVGQPLANEKAFFAERSRLFDPLCLSRVLVKKHAQEVERGLTELVGLTELGWVREAQDAAEKVIVAEIAHHCATRGENYPNHKWRYEKLFRIYGRQHPVTDRFRSLENEIGVLTGETAFQRWAAEVSPETEALWGTIRYRVHAKPTSFVLVAADECWLWVGNQAYEIDQHTAELWGALRAEGSGVEFSRSEALRHAAGLRTLRATGAVLLDLVLTSAQAAESSREPTDGIASWRFPRPIDARALLCSRLTGWWAWIDYQSYVDDFNGAVQARQWEAAFVAMRCRIGELLRPWFSERTRTIVTSEQAWLLIHECQALGTQNVEKIRRSLPGTEEATRELLALGESLCEQIVRDGVPRIPGNIREEESHRALFQYGAAWIETAERLGVGVELPGLMVDKAKALATGTAIR